MALQVNLMRREWSRAWQSLLQAAEDTEDAPEGDGGSAAERGASRKELQAALERFEELVAQARAQLDSSIPPGLDTSNRHVLGSGGSELERRPTM